MTGPDWRPTVIVVDPADPNWKYRLAVATPVASPENGAPVSFCDAAVGLSPANGWPPARHWRDLLPSSLLDSLWRASYEDIRVLLKTLPAGRRSCLDCYLHVLADALTRHRAWDYLAESVRPALVILPPGSELVRRSRKTRYAQSLLARLLGGHHNVIRVRGWFASSGESHGRVVEARAFAGQATSGALLVVEDGVSAVHRDPALAIANELTRRGFPPRILTSSPELAKVFADHGHVVSEVRPKSFVRLILTFATDFSCLWYVLRRSLTRAATGAQAVEIDFMAWFLRSLPVFIARRLLLLEGVERAAEPRPVEAVLTLGESFPLAITALSWARERGIPDAAFTPVLIGNRPDNEDFPASRHLVYGSQAAECMVRHGVMPDSIDVVGSPTFENVLGRNREADIKIIRLQMQNWQVGERLLVVATEALPNPAEELAPILQASAGLEGLHTVVKIHPADSPATIAALVAELGLAERVDILVNCDLAALLHAADLLMCVLSNIAVTASLLGTPTLVPTFSRRVRPVDFVAEGFATACDNVAQLPSQISDLSSQGPIRQAAIARMRAARQRFAGPGDGGSHIRVAEAVIQMLTQDKYSQFAT